MYTTWLGLNRGSNLHACAVAADNAQNAKWYPQPQAFETTDGPLPMVMRQEYAAGLVPSLLVYAGFGRVVVAAAGIEGQQDAMQVYRGYGDLQTPFDHPGKVNSYAKLWAENAAAAIQPFMNPTTQKWLFIGHSWGAAVVTILANKVKRFNPAWEVRVCSFGSPRFCNRAYVDGCNFADHKRVHNHQDPVPYIIPWFNEAPFFHSLHTPLQILAMNSMVHIGQGVHIQRGEEMAYTDTKTGYAYPLEFNPLRMRAMISSGVGPHLTHTYVEVLAAHVDPPMRSHAGIIGPAPRLGGESPPVLTKSDAAIIADFPKQGWIKHGQPGENGPPTPPPLVPLPPFQAPPSRRAGIHLRKVGKRWYVFSGEDEIYKATGKRDALGWANSLRQFRKQYRQNPTGVSNPDALVQAVAGHVPFA